MTIVISPSSQGAPALTERRWLEPLRTETLSHMVEAANHLAVSKGCAHAHKTFNHSQASAMMNQDPHGAASTTYTVTLPYTSAFASEVEVIVWYQGHDHVSTAQGPFLGFWTSDINGALLDPPAASGATYGVQMSVSNGQLAPGQGRRIDFDGSVMYPMRSVALSQVPADSIPNAAYPTFARALSMGTAAQTGNALQVHVTATYARVHAISVNEVPPRFV
jgi:hypothetical protein